jgi:hypothetical protein
MKNKNLRNFIILILCAIFISYLSSKFLFTDALILDYLQFKIAKDKIAEFVSNMTKWGWLNYLFIPLIYAIKLSIIAGVIYLGLFFMNLSIDFSKVFGVAIIAEFIFLIPLIAKLLWFVFIQTEYSLLDLQHFHPFSAINFFNYNTIEKYWIYPLSKINIFEFLYWFALAYGTSKVIKKDLTEGMKVVLSSYVPASIVWMVFILFISIQ